MSEQTYIQHAPGVGAHLHRLEHVMGMPIGVDVCDSDIEAKTVDRVYQWLRFVDATFSTYREDSEISRLNRGELALEQTHPAVRSVLRRCERLRVQTDGYFDVRAPLQSADKTEVDCRRFEAALVRRSTRRSVPVGARSDGARSARRDGSARGRARPGSDG